MITQTARYNDDDDDDNNNKKNIYFLNSQTFSRISYIWSI